jgi:PfaB family protein
MSCLFPGASTPKAYWERLINGQDCRSQADAEKMGLDPTAYFDPKKGVTDRFYFLDGGFVRGFSAQSSLADFPKEQLEGKDDSFLWPLFVGNEAIKDSKSALAGTDKARVGLILADLNFPTKSSNRLFVPLYLRAVQLALQGHWHGQKICPLPDKNSPFYPPGRNASWVAEKLGLCGPVLCLDAACASSLYAVKVAADYLYSGRADVMLAGAVSAADPFFVTMGFSIFQACPQKGKSRPLDKNSGGLAAGEGAGMFVLKRLEDAISQGDNIHAVIAGVGLSNDGRGASVLSPHPKGQKLAFERAWEYAGLNPAQLGFVECHATGTPRGDKVEIDSADAFFGANGAAPLAGSVKSNLGHLLTSAGMAGMIKASLCIKNRKIPPTINLANPLESKCGVVSRSSLPAFTVDWPDFDEKPLAAVNAFGFGGTDAHAIIAPANLPALAQTGQKAKEPVRLAITGLDCLFGPFGNTDAFLGALLRGDQGFKQVPKNRWCGMEKDKALLEHFGFEGGKAPLCAYVESLEADFARFKIPPGENDRLIPQQLALMRVADRALIEADVAQASNTAVVVAMGADLSLHRFRGRVSLETELDNADEIFGSRGQQVLEAAKNAVNNPASATRYTSFIGNIMACRMAALWDFSGPAFTVTAGSLSAFRALELAWMLLENREVSAVVLGAVDLCAGMEYLLYQNRLAPLNTGPMTLAFDRAVNGPMTGEGAAAIVIKRLDDASLDKDRVFATLESMAFACAGEGKNPVADAARKAMSIARIQPQETGFVEAGAYGDSTATDMEANGLLEAYGHNGKALSIALSGVCATVGHTGAASGMAGLVKAILCLKHRFIPAIPNWSGPAENISWEKGPFYFPCQSRPFFTTAQKPRRLGSVSAVSQEGCAAHVILGDIEQGEQSPGKAFSSLPGRLFLFRADSVEGLLDQIKNLEAQAAKQDDIGSLAENLYLSSPKKARFALALCAKDKDSLKREISLATQGIAESVRLGKDWLSASGSCFSPNPQAKEGKIAFVYPGAFNAYQNMGAQLYTLFPSLYKTVLNEPERLEELSGADSLFSRSLNRLTSREEGESFKEFLNTPIRVFEAGILFAVAATDVLREHLEISPDIALGYSMGEVSMHYALNVWERSDAMSCRLRQTDLFTTQIAGPMHAVRKAWQLGEGKNEQKEIWCAFGVKADAISVKKALKGCKRAYLGFINTPDECVITGHPQEVERVLARLNCQSWRVDMTDAIHCDIVQPLFDRMADLHRLETRPVFGVDFYSAVTNKPIDISSNSIARNIAQIYCQPIDFVSLVKSAYNDGARVFVDVGPRENCAAWIGKILADKPHAAAFFNRKGADDHTSLLRLAACLFAHQADMNLEFVFPFAHKEEKAKNTLPITVAPGGPPIRETLEKALDEIFKEGAEQSLPSLKNAVLAEDKKIVPPSSMPEPNDKTPNPPLAHTAADGVQNFSGNPALTDKKGKEFLPESWQEQAAPQMGLSANPQKDQLPFPGVADLMEKNADVLLAASRSHESFLNRRHQEMLAAASLVSAHARLLAGQGRAGGEHLAPSRTLAQNPLPHKAPSADKPEKPAAENAIWNTAALKEFAGGSIAKVFGPSYSIIDNYKRRVRLPMEPYLLVSRVTELSAKMGEFKPSSMTTEYDIPLDSWYSIDGQAPWAVCVESGQCDLLLISYLGIDFECKGELVYRLLDCTLNFLDELPKEGQTLKYCISIDSFARSGDNLLFFFRYDCFADDRLILTMRNGCAGFFSDSQLAAGKGIVCQKSEEEQRQNTPKSSFTPLLLCSKFSFDKEDLLAIVDGNPSACFGENYDQQGKNPSLRFSSRQMLMIDRVTNLNPSGGPWGLGKILAEKDLAPDHWYFPCHFKDDEVLAGSLMAEGCVQLLQFYLLYLGVQTKTVDARFQPIVDLPQKVRCRGQVTPINSKISYSMEIKRISLNPQPLAVADVDIICDGKVVVDFKELGVRLVEKSPGNFDSFSSDKSPEKEKPIEIFSKSDLEQFATGSLTKCFGEAFSIYENRQPPRTPNSELQLISRVVDIGGTPGDFKNPAFVTAQYLVPDNAWFFTQNAWPGVLPYSVIMEIALQPCGFVSTWAQTTLIKPETDFFFRNLDGTGRLKKLIPLAGKTIVNKSALLSTVSTKTAIIQKFTFVMEADGEVFYEGDAVFGYFTKGSLINQVGLDGGQNNHPMHTRQFLPQNLEEGVKIIDLSPNGQYESLLTAPKGKPHWRLSGPMLNFLDKAIIVPQGGKYALGYVYAQKQVNGNDWFFPCHFHNDPVMPGSLGVEAILEAMQVFALEAGLGKDMASPGFTHALDTTVWKYRGQITPANKLMSIEVHIKSVTDHEGLRIISADASLWKENIRIYEITDARIAVRDFA